MHRERMAGEKNPNFRDGGHLGHYRKRFRKAGSILLRIAIPRCEECGSEQTITHHIDQNKQNDTIENLVVLCKSCHMRFHKANDPSLRESMTLRWKKITASYADRLTPTQYQEIVQAMA